jgi:hypothetical protein
MRSKQDRQGLASQIRQAFFDQHWKTPEPMYSEVSSIEAGAVPVIVDTALPVRDIPNAASHRPHQ